MRIIFCLMVFLFIGKNTMLAQQLSSFVEYGAALHTGDNTPLWQVSNQQGLTSLDNNTYIRGGISYKHQLGKWKFEEALDLVAAAGFSTTSFIVQQAYVDIRYKWFGFFAGSREQNSPLLNQELSSGGMTWSPKRGSNCTYSGMPICTCGMGRALPDQVMPPLLSS